MAIQWAPKRQKKGSCQSIGPSSALIAGSWVMGAKARMTWLIMTRTEAMPRRPWWWCQYRKRIDGSGEE